MSTTTATRVSPEEYLEFERTSPLRHEYRNGEIVEVTGASRRHNAIEINLARIISTALLERQAEVFGSSMRVKIGAREKYVYPDAVVVIGEPEFEDVEVDTLLNPTLVFEILSESTERYDRGAKFEDYQSVETVTDYFLVSQNEHHIGRFTRQKGADWLYREYKGADAIVELSAIDCELNLRDVYHKVPLQDSSSD